MLKGAANTARLKMAQTHPTARTRLIPFIAKMVTNMVKPKPPTSAMSIITKVEICNIHQNIDHVTSLLPSYTFENEQVYASILNMVI